MKDYYAQLDKAIKEHEYCRPCPQHQLSWIADKITWCWKWRKITHDQLEELCDRMVHLFKGDY